MHETGNYGLSFLATEIYNILYSDPRRREDMPKLSPSKHEKLATRIHKEFQGLLIAGEFTPGERLKVADLVEQTGTSITPVREALIQLVSENAVEMYSPRAFAIPQLSLDRYREIRAMRMALERLATQEATPHLTPRDLDKLETSHDGFVAAEKAGDGRTTLRSNREFHFRIYQAARMPLLLTNIERLWAMMGPILNVFYAKMDNDYIGAAEHLNILEAFRAGDAEAAGRAMQADLQRGGESMERYIAQQIETTEVTA
jgi:DNA-binding GntR family transcriptional regulator